MVSPILWATILAITLQYPQIYWHNQVTRFQQNWTVLKVELKIWGRSVSCQNGFGSLIPIELDEQTWIDFRCRISENQYKSMKAYAREALENSPPVRYMHQKRLRKGVQNYSAGRSHVCCCQTQHAGICFHGLMTAGWWLDNSTRQPGEICKPFCQYHKSNLLLTHIFTQICLYT